MGTTRRANEREVYAERARSGRTSTKAKRENRSRPRTQKRQLQNVDLKGGHYTTKKHHLETACGILGLLGLGWELDVLGTGMKGKFLAVPGDGAGEARG
jgi:hypothetical protein